MSRVAVDRSLPGSIVRRPTGVGGRSVLVTRYRWGVLVVGRGSVRRDVVGSVSVGSVSVGRVVVGRVVGRVGVGCVLAVRRGLISRARRRFPIRDFDESVPAEPSVDDPVPVDDFFEFGDDEEVDDDAEEESLADVDEESPAAGSAYATPGVDAMATPTPSVTANAPTRPMCLA